MDKAVASHARIAMTWVRVQVQSPVFFSSRAHEVGFKTDFLYHVVQKDILDTPQAKLYMFVVWQF